MIRFIDVAALLLIPQQSPARKQLPAQERLGYPVLSPLVSLVHLAGQRN